MKTVVALACAGWLTVPNADPPSTLPLAFGMTPQDVANVLRAPLTYDHGRPGDEVFYVNDSRRRSPASTGSIGGSFSSSAAAA